MRLIVGLGNPGESYVHSRHNIGFRCITHLARSQGIPLKQWQCHSRTGSGKIGEDEILLAKPHTFMNRSGRAVNALVQRFDISLDNLLIVHDDMDLPLGRIRLRTQGSAAGHKGMESIITSLGSEEFPRLRVGIGHPFEDVPDTISYVLGDFTPEEETIIKNTCTMVTEAILCLLEEGIVSAMNKFNK